jgi:hypothetical protein
MNAALDVAIGLILMYLVLSLFCTTINELISGILKWRSKSLKSALEELIDDPNLKAAFYSHGLINEAKTASSGGSAHSADTYPSYLDSKDVAMALLGSLGTSKNLPIPTIATIQQAVLTTLSENCKIRDVLSICLAECESDINKLRDHLAAWFDTAMDRLSGAYKRKIQWMSLFIGLVIAIAFNADTVHVAAALWRDPVLAEMISQNATKLVSSGSDVDNLQLPANPDCRPPANTIPARSATGAPPAQPTPPNPAQRAYKLCLLSAQIQAFPIGWTDKPANCGDVLWKIVGLLATMMALSLGATFWFDLLTKFVNLRAAGKKPQRTQTPKRPT